MKFKNNSFFKKLIVCSFLSIITAMFYYTYINSELKNNTIILECLLQSKTQLNIDLYSDYGEGFNELDKKSIVLPPSDSLIQFTLDKRDGVFLNKIRLDFNPQNHSVLLRQINFYKEGEIWLSLDTDNLNEKINFISEKNSMVRKIDGILISMNTNDFYISFVDNYNLFTSNFLKSTILLWPWILFFGSLTMKKFIILLNNKNYFFILVCLFIFSIFFKDAWSTLSVLLIGAWGIYDFFKSKSFRIQNEQLGLILFFILILIIGQIEAFKQINIHLGIFIIPLFLAMSKQTIPKNKLYTFYCNLFLIFMCILINSLVISIFIYNEVNVQLFLETKKTILGYITYWIVYKNATFLSFFILIGFVLSQHLFSKKLVHRNYHFTYTILALVSVFILGSRIALIVYFILLAITQISLKWTILSYIILFLILYTYIYVNIESIDYYRYVIWEKTISSNQNIFFGNGLGSTEDLLLTTNNQYITEKINHPHNQYITYFYELGIFGIICLVFLFLYYGALYFYQNEKERVSVLFILLALMITESPFETSKPLFIFAFFISIHTGEKFKWKDLRILKLRKRYD
jgi:hypothetical protein